MCDSGYKLTQNKIESRWHSLMRTFKECKSNNQKTGKKRKSFDYFMQMDEILGKRRDINSVCIAGSGVKKQTDLNNNDKVSVSSDNGTD